MARMTPGRRTAPGGPLDSGPLDSGSHTRIYPASAASVRVRASPRLPAPAQEARK